MLVLGKDVIGKMIVNSATDEDKAKVDDVLIDIKKVEVAYITFELKTPVSDDGESSGGSRTYEIANASASQTMPGNWGSTTERAPGSGTRDQLFLVPKDNIVRITEQSLVMKGTEVEQEGGDMSGHMALSTLVDLEVITEAGEKIGKIKDIVIDEQTKKIVGFKLSEGLWEKIIGDGTKYMPMSGIVSWDLGRVTVQSRIVDVLVDEFDQLVE